MSFYVYIIQCVDGSFYTGYTKNVRKRARMHAAGKGARYTKTHKPLEVVLIETFNTRSSAMKRERQIKKLNHEQKANLIISKKEAKT